MGINRTMLTNSCPSSLCVRCILRGTRAESEIGREGLTKSTIEPVRGECGSDDVHHGGSSDPAAPLDASGTAAAKRYCDEYDHDEVCTNKRNSHMVKQNTREK